MARRGVCRDAALLALMAMLAFAAAAELSGDDYVPPAQAPATAAERRRIAEALEADRRREAAEAAAREAAAREAAARESERLARRPLGERLTESRCTACHAPAVVQARRQGPLGWRWTVERMRWWHGAPLAAGEAALIAHHLAATQGAGRARQIAEWGVVLGLAALLPAAWGWRRWRQCARRRAAP